VLQTPKVRTRQDEDSALLDETYVLLDNLLKIQEMLKKAERTNNVISPFGLVVNKVPVD
jgi:hypothetical protein